MIGLHRLVFPLYTRFCAILLSSIKNFQIYKSVRQVMVAGGLKLSRCKRVETCHDWNEERKGPYQAKDNGDMREKDGEKKTCIQNRFELRTCLSGFYTVSPTCSALRAVVKKSKLWGRDS